MEGELDWLQMLMGLFGGLALFLYGMEMMSNGLKAAAGSGLKTLLARLTVNRVAGAATGAVVTAIINSSSVTTVLVVGFVTSGVMTLSQSIGVIMGANIGSTFTAQILAFNVTQYSLAMIAIGFGMLFLSKVDRVRHYGNMLMGLGLVFFGMGVMSQGMEPLRDYQPFIDFMAKMERPVLGILVGAVFTGLVQSSAATTGLVIVMATEGMVTLEAGIAIALGANIGTCVTALMAALGKPVEAVRTAGAHVLFNILGVLIWLPFIPELAAFVQELSPVAEGLEGKARLAEEVPRQIANANTAFNLINTLLFLPFTTQFARVVVRLIPEKPAGKRIIEPKYLDDSALGTPAIALENVRQETGHLGALLESMIQQMINERRTNMDKLSDYVGKKAAQFHLLYKDSLDYLSRIDREAMSEKQTQEMVRLISAINALSNMKDLLATGMLDAMQEATDKKIVFSDTMNELYQKLVEKGIVLALHQALKAVVEQDEQAAQEVMFLKNDVRRYVSEAQAHQAISLDRGREDSLKQFRYEMSVIDTMKALYNQTKQIARVMLPEAVRETGD